MNTLFWLNKSFGGWLYLSLSMLCCTLQTSTNYLQRDCMHFIVQKWKYFERKTLSNNIGTD